jgi:tRNA G37 N-methylase Trm5
LNLREPYFPYKEIIAQVIVDKNPSIRTVINKIDDVGAENEFRTFNYEVLAGPDDMNVEINEAGCIFKFDYSAVYYNTKLGTEHQRLVDLFKPGEVVADVMAGVGPFAVPAGKKQVFVWANDKNPESYKYLEEAIKRNKVSSEIFYPQQSFISQSLLVSDGFTCDLVLTATRYTTSSKGSTTMATSSSRKPRTSSSRPRKTAIVRAFKRVALLAAIRRSSRPSPPFPSHQQSLTSS